MVSQEGHSAQLLKVKRDEAPAGGSSREQAHGGLRDADTTKRLRKVPRLGRGGEGRGTLARGVPGGRRMSPGLQNPSKQKPRGFSVLTLDYGGMSDQGQISKLMLSRLEGQGLVENTRVTLNRPITIRR